MEGNHTVLRDGRMADGHRLRGASGFGRIGRAGVVLVLVACSGKESARSSECPWSSGYPEAVASGGASFQFARDGCRLGVSVVEFAGGDGSFVETWSFEPPLAIADDVLATTGEASGTYLRTIVSGGSTREETGGFSAVLTREPVGASGGLFEQWATAVIEARGTDPSQGSPAGATGSPDTSLRGSNDLVWLTQADAPEVPSIVLGFDTPVVPYALRVWEAAIPGFIRRAEALDPATGEWRTLWEGHDRTAYVPGYLAMEAALLPRPTERIRLTVEPIAGSAHGVDAVKLVGAAGWRYHVTAEVRIDGAEVPLSLRFLVDTFDGSVGVPDGARVGS